MKKRAVLLLSLALFFRTFYASAANYSIIDLGSLGGSMTRAAALNEGGEIAGTSHLLSGVDHAYLWRTNQMLDLGTLGGSNSAAFAINQVGQIVGWAQTPDGRNRACVFGTETNVDISGNRPRNSYAATINDQGEVAGWCDTDGSGEAFHAFLFRPNLLDLGATGGARSRVMAINNFGEAAGWMSDTAWLTVPGEHAALWHELDSVSAPTLLQFDAESHVYSLNHAGQAAGAGSTDYFHTRAMIWLADTRIDLGALAGTWSSAAGINDSGEVVGSSDAYHFGLITNRVINLSGLEATNQITAGYSITLHAFLWRNGALVDLNNLIPTNSGWELAEATAINNSGQIVGNGNFNGEKRAFLLTPSLEPIRLPFIRLSSPFNDDFISGTNATLRAEVVPGGNPISRVEFFIQRVTRTDSPYIELSPLSTSESNTNHPPGFAGTATQPPYQIQLSGLVPGNYAITAQAIDTSGISVHSAEGLLRMSSSFLQLFPLLGGFGGNLVDQQLFLHVNGNEELNYDIETSDDLIHWTKIGTTSPDPVLLGLKNISDDLLTHSQRYYRAVSR